LEEEEEEEENRGVTAFLSPIHHHHYYYYYYYYYYFHYYRYEKTHPVPGVELNVKAGHASRPPTVDTPFGKVGAAICFDMVRALLFKR